MDLTNQAGWNKRAGRANFEAMINKQRPKTSKETLAAKYKTEGYSVYHEIQPTFVEIPTNFDKNIVKKQIKHL